MISSDLSKHAVLIVKYEGKDCEAVLTDREKDVALLTAEGLDAKEIGKRLGIGRRTVEQCRTSIYQKLQLDNQAALVQWAVKAELIPRP